MYSKEAIEFAIEDAINDIRTVWTCSYCPSICYPPINVSNTEAHKFLLSTNEVKFTKADYLDSPDVVQKTYIIGRTSKHISKMKSDLTGTIRYRLPTKETGALNFSDHNIYPQTVCWPDQIENIVTRYQAHYPDGFIFVVGADLKNATEKFYSSSKIQELGIKYNFRALIQDMYTTVANKTKPINHGFWYKILPRESYKITLTAQYSVDVKRVPRHQHVTVKFLKDLNLTSKPVKSLEDTPGLEIVKTRDRWKVM